MCVCVFCKWIRSDSIIFYNYRRPLDQPAASIGVWYDLLEFIGTLACVTNVSSLVYSTGNDIFDYYFFFLMMLWLVSIILQKDISSYLLKLASRYSSVAPFNKWLPSCLMYFDWFYFSLCLQAFIIAFTSDTVPKTYYYFKDQNYTYAVRTWISNIIKSKRPIHKKLEKWANCCHSEPPFSIAWFSFLFSFFRLKY